MGNAIYINVATDLNFDFGLEWNGFYLPRTGESISFDCLITKTDVHNDYRHILEKNIFVVEDLYWVNYDEIYMHVKKIGESKTLSTDEYREYLISRGILVVV